MNTLRFFLGLSFIYMSDFLKYPAKNAKKQQVWEILLSLEEETSIFYECFLLESVSPPAVFCCRFPLYLNGFFEILFFSLGLKNGRYRVAKPNCLPLSHYICQKKFANLVLHTRFFEFSANYPTYVRISQTFISSIQPKKDTSFRQCLNLLFANIFVNCT